MSSNVQTSVISILSRVYPVGCIYTTTVSTNPATSLGFGTWVAYAAGRALIGVGQDVQDFTISAVDTGAAEAVTVASNNTIYTGTPVLYDTTSGAIGGLTDNTTYYAIRNSATSFSLATTLALALAGTKINLTSSGSGTQILRVTGTNFAAASLYGEETHALTIAELAAHTHTQRGAGTGGATTTATYATTNTATADQIPTASTGGSTAHNVLQPSIAVYFWKRTA